MVSKKTGIELVIARPAEMATVTKLKVAKSVHSQRKRRDVVEAKSGGKSHTLLSRGSPLLLLQEPSLPAAILLALKRDLVLEALVLVGPHL